MMRDWYGVTGKAGIERRKGSLYQSRCISHALSVTLHQSAAQVLRMRPAARQEGRVLPALRREAAARAKEKMDRINKINKIQTEISFAVFASILLIM
jgi:hypothetical protein